MPGPVADCDLARSPRIQPRPTRRHGTPDAVQEDDEITAPAVLPAGQLTPAGPAAVVLSARAVVAPPAMTPASASVLSAVAIACRLIRPARVSEKMPI